MRNKSNINRVGPEEDVSVINFKSKINKSAQFFSLYLVFLTLLMSGTVIGFYFIQQGNVASSLVSPLLVLEVRDNLSVFEMSEKELIKKSLDATEADFGDDAFLKEFRDNFISGFVANDKMMEFIFSNLVWDGRIIKKGLDRDSFVKNVLYSEGKSEINSNGLSFVRAKIGKSFSLRAKEVAEINFPVDFNFEFEKKYLINFKDGEWVIS